MPTFLLPTEAVTSLDDYLASEIGGKGVACAQAIGPQNTIAEVERSGLRGRGGGGFPTGRKWAGIAEQQSGRRYLVVNGAEGEPGTFKDRALLRANPYQLVEGLIIAAFAVGATEVFVCLKASFEREIEAVTNAVQDMQSAGICTDCKVTVVARTRRVPLRRGEGDPRGDRGQAAPARPAPALPPWPVRLGPQTGSQATPQPPRRPHESNPTLVNNAETLSNVPWILARGPEWFRTMGSAVIAGARWWPPWSATSPAPVVTEVEMGIRLSALLDGQAGGPLPAAPGRPSSPGWRTR